MLLKRFPSPILAPFVKEFWLIDTRGGAAKTGAPAREHVLPTGSMHLAFRLSGGALKIYENERDLLGRQCGAAVVGGARASFYLRGISSESYSIGAVLRPSSGESVFGCPAAELAGRHTDLADIWGDAAVGDAFEMMSGNAAPADKFKILEAFLLARIKPDITPHAAVAFAAEQLAAGARIEAIVRHSGFSHRHFAQLFRRQVGLHPKAFLRVRRFAAALAQTAQTAMPLADVAYAAGYSDQAHFARDFKEFSGLTPGLYRRVAPVFRHHVPERSN